MWNPAYLHFWLVVWNIFYFSTYWEFHHPNWRTHIFRRGRSTTSQYLLYILRSKCRNFASCAFFVYQTEQVPVFVGRFCQRNCGWFTKMSFRLEGQIPCLECPCFGVPVLKAVGITSKILVSSKLICFEILEVYGIPSIIPTLFGGFNKILKLQ